MRLQPLKPVTTTTTTTKARKAVTVRLFSGLDNHVMK
jgi:hypothetical protein